MKTEQEIIDRVKILVNELNELSEQAKAHKIFFSLETPYQLSHKTKYFLNMKKVLS